MFKKYIYFFSFISVLGCSKGNSDQKIIKINLKKVSDKSIFFNKLYTTIRFSSQEKLYPRYYNYLLKNYKGIPKSDSLYISYNNADFNSFLAELYNKGFVDIEKINQYKIDLNEEKKKPKLEQLGIVVYFKNKKKYLIIDVNSNWDFSDNITIELNKEFKKATTFNYRFWQKIDSTIIYFNREIELIPNSIYDYDTNNNEEDRSEVLFKFKDYWKGSFNYNNQGYDIAVNGVNPYLDIFIKPESFSFSEKKYEYNKNFNYNIKDTISLHDSLFILESITAQTSKLILRKIKNNPQFKSNKIGARLFNFTLKDLNKKKFKVSELGTKKYILLDFWGTWCKPCREIAPKLKSMNEKFSNILNIIGVAYDKEIDEVKKYVNQNNINWRNSFFKRSQKTGIIKDLEIQRFPTFILLDKNNIIIYKGPGEESLKEIEKILEKK